jgi:hypothetical protein
LAVSGAGADFSRIGRQMGELGIRVLHGEDTAPIPDALLASAKLVVK